MRLNVKHMAGWRRNDGLAAAARTKVLAALRRADGPLTIAEAALNAGLTYWRARRALETLCALGAVADEGAKNRLYQLVVPGMGERTGGPASESAAAACAGFPPAAARPGRAA